MKRRELRSIDFSSTTGGTGGGNAAINYLCLDERLARGGRGEPSYRIKMARVRERRLEEKRKEKAEVDPWIGQRLGSVARLNRNTHALIMRVS